MSYTTTDNFPVQGDSWNEKCYIYISHLDDEYKYWKLPAWPESITDSMQSNFSQTQALGRTAPVFTYANSGPRSVSITIKLLRDLMDDENVGFSNSTLLKGEDYVKNLINALQAIALPKYNLSNKAVEPPLVAVRFGEQLFIKGVVTSAVTVTYNKPILANGLYNQVDIGFTISEVDPYDATSVFQNGGFRGMTKTLSGNMGGD